MARTDGWAEKWIWERRENGRANQSQERGTGAAAAACWDDGQGEGGAWLSRATSGLKVHWALGSGSFSSSDFAAGETDGQWRIEVARALGVHTQSLHWHTQCSAQQQSAATGKRPDGEAATGKGQMTNWMFLVGSRSSCSLSFSLSLSLSGGWVAENE
ncbi:hypothetical protein DM02DRAFT_433380 [Periconia macrospinosa]|uniref:Uncharacterized protein n=1 Tax=Periconia macrospinosa TaxID=97972 RepID=A0A2V1DMI1_9PLEO|nr:hypothetical protein DM02DRAFT_433380 [Periconia macrospinosa]